MTTFEVSSPSSDILNPSSSNSKSNSKSNSNSNTNSNGNNNNAPNEFLLAQTQKLEECTKLSPLPYELMDKILRYTYFNDIEKVYSINSNVKSFGKSISMVNSEFYLLSLKYLYKYANFTRSTSFDKFLKNLQHNPYLGNYVHFLDFSEFTSVGLGRTGQMMHDIQMVTDQTIMECLLYTPNLKEFLASESIQGDLNQQIIDYLFNDLKNLEAIDFCGCSGYSFIESLRNLTVNENNSLKKLSFHDCTDIQPDPFTTILSKLNVLERLDLMHTQISTKILAEHLNENARLTHLSLARCSRLGTTRELIEFLTKHPTVSRGTLRWLNLQVDQNIASPFNQHTLSFLLRNMNAPELRYLNLSGIEVQYKHLELIAEKYPQMESLVLSHSQITIDELLLFLPNCKSLKFIDLVGNKNITRWSLDNYKLLTYCPTLEAIEVDYKVCEVLDDTSKKIRIYNTVSNNVEIWKSFNDNGQGRRAWIFKLNDEQLKKELNGQPLNFNNNAIYFDINTGEKIFQKIKFPTFLKYASRKINCSKGLFKSIQQAHLQEETVDTTLTLNNNSSTLSLANLNQAQPAIVCATEETLPPPTTSNTTSANDAANDEDAEDEDGEFVEECDPMVARYDTFPVEFSERGLYKYYSLNK